MDPNGGVSAVSPMSAAVTAHTDKRYRCEGVEVIRGCDLTESICARWSDLQGADETFASPYFSPEFTRLIAAVRDDTFVGVMHSGGEPVGFFPFQRGRLRIGKPVGGVLSDYQGVIVADNVDWDAAELVRACDLAAWDFDHLVASQLPFAVHRQLIAASPLMGLSDGYEAYIADRCKQGGDKIKDLQRLERKLNREHGTVIFTSHLSDCDLLDALITWKTAQFVRTGVRNLFCEPWIRSYMRLAYQTKTPRFAGILSALRAGDRTVAVSLDLQSARVRHGTFTAYDPEFSRYSPGMLLLLRSAQEAAIAGMQWFDLGKGDTPYKAQLMSGSVALAEGRVECSRSVALVRRAGTLGATAIRCSPLRRPARFVKRRVQACREFLDNNRT